MQHRIFHVDTFKQLYKRYENAEISISRLVEILNKQCMNWQKDTPKDKPDYDGFYLCHIVRDNECGTLSKYQRVVELRFNVWQLSDPREKLTHWCITPPPELEDVAKPYS